MVTSGYLGVIFLRGHIFLPEKNVIFDVFFSFGNSGYGPTFCSILVTLRL